MWETFGSRSEYLNAPLDEAMEQELRIYAKHNVEAKQYEEQQAEIEASKREAGRYR